jgi:hypothetical protein
MRRCDDFGRREENSSQIFRVAAVGSSGAEFFNTIGQVLPFPLSALPPWQDSSAVPVSGRSFSWRLHVTTSFSATSWQLHPA